jgi:hypothetical protein
MFSDNRQSGITKILYTCCFFAILYSGIRPSPDALHSMAIIHFYFFKYPKMKHYSFLTVFALLFIISCHKEPGILQNETNYHYLENVQRALKDNLRSENYRELDFLKTVLTRNDSLHLYVLRIPFSILIDRESGADRSKNHKSLNCEISVSALNQSSILQSKVNNGFIEVVHQPGVRVNSPVVPDPTLTLPKVIVVASYSPATEVSWSTYISIISLFHSTSPVYMSFESTVGCGDHRIISEVPLNETVKSTLY